MGLGPDGRAQAEGPHGGYVSVFVPGECRIRREEIHRRLELRAIRGGHDSSRAVDSMQVVNGEQRVVVAPGVDLSLWQRVDLNQALAER
jgi:hypothetical protein